MVERAEQHGAGQGRLQQVGVAVAPGHDVVDLEGHADAEQQRQRDDVGEIEWLADQHHDFQRHGAGDQQRQQGQQYVAEAPQGDPQDQRDRHHRQAPASMKAQTTVRSPLGQRDRRAGRLRRRGEHGVRRSGAKSRRLGRPWAAPRCGRGRPDATQSRATSGGIDLIGDRRRPQHGAHPVELDLERHDQRGLRPCRAAPCRRRRAASAGRPAASPTRRPRPFCDALGCCSRRRRRAAPRRRRHRWAAAARLGVQHRPERGGGALRRRLACGSWSSGTRLSYRADRVDFGQGRRASRVIGRIARPTARMSWRR